MEIIVETDGCNLLEKIDGWNREFWKKHDQELWKKCGDKFLEKVRIIEPYISEGKIDDEER